MSYPTRYTRQYDYVSYQNANPSRPLPAPKVNADFNSAAQSSKEIVDFLEGIARDDGRLANGSVGYDQLSASLRSRGIAGALPWQTGVTFFVGDAVVVDGTLYRCLTDHIASIFAADLAAGKWLEIADLPVIDYDFPEVLAWMEGVPGDGTDQTAALQAIVEGLPNGRGRIRLKGTVCITALNLAGKNYIQFVGDGRVTTTITITAGAIGSTNSVIEMYGSTSVEFRDMSITTNNAAFNGIMIRAGATNPGSTDTSFPYFENVNIGCNGTSSSTMLWLYGATLAKFNRCRLQSTNGKTAQLQNVAGAVQFTNGLTFFQCAIYGTPGLYAIQGSGDCIKFIDCNIQNASDGKGQLYDSDLNAPFRVVLVQGNTFYTDYAPSGVSSWVRCHIGHAIDMSNNFVSLGALQYPLELGGGADIGGDFNESGIMGFAFTKNQVLGGKAGIKFVGSTSPTVNTAARGGEAYGNSLFYQCEMFENADTNCTSMRWGFNRCYGGVVNTKYLTPGFIGLPTTAGSPVVINGAGGTPSSINLSNGTNLPIAGLTGLGTGIAAALAANVGSAGAPVLFNGPGGTPASITLTNGAGLPISTGVSGLSSNVAALLASFSSANLRAALTDESGTGAAYFQGGDLGTPSAGVGTNLTGTATGLTAGNATNAVNSGITNDTTTNATMYPTWATATSGNNPLKVTSTKFTFNPAAGSLAIGNTARTDSLLSVEGSILSGSTQLAMYFAPTFSSGATGSGYGGYFAPNTAAASFTMANLFNLRLANGVKGAGSSITTQYQLYIENPTMGTTGYGILVAGGRNNLAGSLSIGTDVDRGAGTIALSGSLYLGSFTVATLPSGVAAGQTVYCSNCRVFNGTGTQEGAAAGTGGMVSWNGSAWKIAGTNVTAVA